MKNAQRRKGASKAPKLTPAGDDPNEKPFPGYARELAALADRKKRAQQAGANPLPGPMREAFAGDPPTLHGFTLQPVTMGLHPILVRLDSPLLAVIRILREELTREDGADESTPELATKGLQARQARAEQRLATDIKTTDEQLVETVFAFTQPVQEIRALLDQGRDTFREAAMKAVADRLHPVQFGELQRVVSAWYAASFSTVVQYEAPKGKDDGTVFTPPPARMTASAGGSLPSAH